MIWACSICDNHFDGIEPPGYCHSCGSPAEYFTEYRHYSERQLGQRYSPGVARAKLRPTYTETCVEGSCFRFHSVTYFWREPSDFYKNFLESRRTFKTQQRFAGAGFNSGFYFGTTRESAIAEQLEYSPLENIDHTADTKKVLEGLLPIEHKCIFLEVTLSIDKIADLSNPIVLRYFLEHGPAKADLGPSDVPYELARLITSAGRGGSRHTDGIGYHASIGGWNGVRFPSVRALQKHWGIQELSKWDVLKKVNRNNPGMYEFDILDQLRNQAIIVVFSGSLLTRSISSYTWTDANGGGATEINPYFGISAGGLESTRLEFRTKTRMSDTEAAEFGYLSDREIAEEFEPNVIWIEGREAF